MGGGSDAEVHPSSSRLPGKWRVPRDSVRWVRENLMMTRVLSEESSTFGPSRGPLPAQLNIDRGRVRAHSRDSGRPSAPLARPRALVKVTLHRRKSLNPHVIRRTKIEQIPVYFPRRRRQSPTPRLDRAESTAVHWHLQTSQCPLQSVGTRRQHDPVPAQTAWRKPRTSVCSCDTEILPAFGLWQMLRAVGLSTGEILITLSLSLSADWTSCGQRLESPGVPQHWGVGFVCGVFLRSGRLYGLTGKAKGRWNRNGGGQDGWGLTF